MERAGGDENCDVEERRTSSQSKDDSLTDFKSPKTDSVAKPLLGKLKIVGEKRPKRASFKGKSLAGSKKKDGSASGRQNEKAQPSIESSFFKAGGSGKREGHTCPLCMRYFEDAYAGTGHTKSCAAKNKVSTTKLLAAVALQERQADERLAIGLPAGPLVQPKDKTPRRNRGAQTLKGDPDLQLALALSKSLQENQAERELEEALLLAAEHRGDEPMPGITDSQRRSTLKNFGFLTNKPVSDVPVKPRRKKHLGPTILQTRTQESRNRLLTERIAEILMGNEAITQVCRQEVTEVNKVEKAPVVLKSRLLKEIHISTKRLWNSAELSKGITNFYVASLGAIVAPAVDLQQDDTATSSQRTPHSEADSSHSKAREIEADSKSDKMSSSSNDRTNDPESSKNIYVSDRQYRNNLPTDWSNTLNVSTMSDVVVLVDKNHIWAHKLVFHVRCSDILLDCQPIDDKRFPHVKEKISWPEVDYLTALAFLEFVYSGVIVKNEHVFADDRIASLVRSLARKYRLKDLFEYMRKRKSEIEKRNEELEGRRSGLRSPIIIEVARDRVAEAVPDESPVAVEEKEEPGASISSPCRRSCIVDLTIAKTPDIDVQLVEDDPPTNRSVTSPDIFDDTTEEAIEDAETNSPEAAEASSRVSTNENSNLRVLAQLIAEDNSARSDETNESDASSTASTFVDDARPEESPVAKRTDKKPSQRHLETPRSRTSSVSNDSKKMNERKKSMSQRLPEKQKSNLSIFIEKVQRINAKSVLDSYNEEESLGEPYDRGRFRNPFNVNNESNRSTSDVAEKADRLVARKGALSALEEQLMLHQKEKKNGIDRTTDESAVFDESSMGRSLEGEAEDEPFVAGKRALGDLEQQSMLQDEKKENGIDLTSADESPVLNDFSSTGNLDLEDSSALENAASTDDENISMYSRYKKSHKHNNSINKYRSLLIKLTEASALASEDDDRRRGSTPRIEEAFDLTQESDSEVESSPTFNVVRSKKRRIRAIVSESNESLPSRENDEDEDKSFTTGDHNDALASSDDAADDSFDEAETTSPPSKGAVGREKRKNIASPVANSVECWKNLSSPEYPDPQVREVDEEMFTQSLKSRRTLTPSPKASNDSAGKSLSRRCKRKSNEGRSKDTNFVDNLEKIETSHRGRSSRGADSLSNFSQYPDLHVHEVAEEIFEVDEEIFEVDEEMFTQSLKSRRTLTPSPKPSIDSAGKSLSRRSKRKSDEGVSKDTNFVDNLEKNESHRAGRSSRGTDRLSNFSQYPDLHIHELDEEIFTQSLKSRRTLTPSPRRSTDSAEKSVSRRCKRKSDEGGSKDTNIVDNSKKNEKSHRANRSSRGPESLSHSAQYPDLDVFEVDEDIFAQSFGSPPSPGRPLTPSPKPKSGSSSRKRGSDGSKAKDTSIADASEKSVGEEEASSSDGRKKRRSSPAYSDFDVFEVEDQIFTQSFRSPSLSPHRALTPSPSCGTSKDDERGRSETPRVSSPILISSSPDMDPDTTRPATKSQDSNKENSFLVAEENATPFYSGRNTLSPPRLDEPTSPKPGPSRRRFSPECGGISPSPAKNPLVRWNSMPTSATNSQRVKRTRTPTKSSRLALSQGVTPPVNYDAMDTPELKRELEKYGIKPQKAHRARQLLTHIFNELHSEVPSTVSDDASDGDEEPPAKKIGRTCSQSSEDSEPESVTSAVSVIPEEMEFADGDAPSNGVDETSNKSSVKQAFTSLIKEDKELQNKMLTYKPLSLELLHLMLKARGFRCKVNDLMDFLDEECITFQVQDQARRQKANRGRGKKTATNGTKNPKSQKS